MPKTVRSVSQVTESLQKRVQTENAAAAVSAGPLKTLMIDPVAAHTVAQEEIAYRALQLFNLSILSIDADNLSQDQISDIEAFGNSRGVPRLSGRRSSGVGYIFRSTAPDSDLVVNNGELVGTEDSTYVFRVKNGPYTMLREGAAAYYNSTDRRYELEVEIESVGFGTEYNVAKTRISRKVSQLADWDGFTNTVETTRGLGEEALSAYIGRLQLLEGYNRSGSKSDSLGDLIATLQAEFQSITDARVLTSAAPSSFKRRENTGPAMDVYVVGTETADRTQIITAAAANEQQWVLDRQPATAVSEVRVNGQVVGADDWELVSDTTRETRDSARSVTSLKLRTTVDSSDSNVTISLGDTITVKYTYNSTVYEAQTYVESSYRDFFDTDILVRLPQSVPVTISFSSSIYSSYDGPTVRDELRTIFLGLLNSPEAWLSEMTPQQLLDATILQSNGLVGARTSTSIQGARFLKMHRQDRGAFDLEILVFDDWEQPTLALSDIDLDQVV